MGRQGSEAWSLITGWMPLTGALSAILSSLGQGLAAEEGMPLTLEPSEQALHCSLEGTFLSLWRQIPGGHKGHITVSKARGLHPGLSLLCQQVPCL